MESQNIYSYIFIDLDSVTPKYKQITNSIIHAVNSGKIGTDYPLPSINDLSFELDISRDTAEKAYRELKHLGIVGSVPGKGYFVTKTDYNQPIKVFLLFNKLSAHKKIIYDAFARSLGEAAVIDFYIYNNDFRLFRKLLQCRREGYTDYVIIPQFMEGGEKAAEVINEIKDGNLILLDKVIPGISRSYGAVYESFAEDLYNALQSVIPALEKYRRLKIIFPSSTYHPKEILTGFREFCGNYGFDYKIVPDGLGNEQIEEGDVYISLMEDDLLALLRKIQPTHLEIGKDVGIISYNETPLKQFILNGITTISTDFEKMGKMTAELVLNKEHLKLPVPFKLTRRKSL